MNKLFKYKAEEFDSIYDLDKHLRKNPEWEPISISSFTYGFKAKVHCIFRKED